MTHTTADTAHRILERDGHEMTLVRLCERLQASPRVKGRPENKTPQKVIQALREDERLVVTGKGRRARVRVV